MMKQFLLRMIVYPLFILELLTMFVSNSAGQPVGSFETTLNFEENSDYYHSLATGKNGWTIGRGNEIELSKDTAIQSCIEKNADSNCQIETVVPINACLAVAESVDPIFGNERYSYYWTVEDSLEIAIPKALEICGEESNRCAIALVTCGRNKILIDKSLESEIQVMLSALGFNPGPVDGKIGRRTKKALNKFLLDNDLSPQEDLDIHTYILLRSAFYKQFPIPRVRYALMKPSHERFTLSNNQQPEQISSATTSPSPTNTECSNDYTFTPPAPNGDYWGWGVWIHGAQMVQWVGPEIWSQEESREIAIMHYNGHPAKVTNLGGCPEDKLCMTFAYPLDGSWAWIGCGKTGEEARTDAISTCEIKHGCTCNTKDPDLQNIKSSDSEWLICLSPQQLAMRRDYFKN